jgi:hypothetical protein
VRPSARTGGYERPRTGGAIWERFSLLDPVLLAVVASSGAFFAYLYYLDAARPGVGAPEGWFGYFDQGQYLRMATDLSNFTLPAEHFLYGLGYPAVAVPFLWLGLDYDPFLVFDAAAFVFVAAATYVVGCRLFSRAVGAIAAFSLVFASPLISYVVTPWNSTVSLVAAAAILLLGTSPRPRLWHAAVIGLMVGWGFAARYVDVVWLGALGAAVLLFQGRPRPRDGAVIASSAALLVALPVLYAHEELFGSPFETPYQLHRSLDGTETDQDLSSYNLDKVPESGFGVFVDPFVNGVREAGTPLLASMFWALAALPGAYLAIRRNRRWRPLFLTFVLSAAAATVFYLSFRATSAGTLQFGTLHYFKMWWPGISVLAGVGLVALVGRIGPVPREQRPHDVSQDRFERPLDSLRPPPVTTGRDQVRGT